MEPHDIASLAACVLLAAATTYGASFSFLGRAPRSQWLSAASGVTVAYVFLGLLPKVVNGAAKVDRPAEAAAPVLEDQSLLLVLAGVLTYYALAVARSRARRPRTGDDGDASVATRLFWGAVTLHGVYLLLVGYVVTDAAKVDLVRAGVLAGVLAVHLVATDFTLGHDGPEGDDAEPSRIGRATLAIAPPLGWVTATFAHLPKVAVIVASAFLAGAVLVNVLLDELPDERDARIAPFVAGALIAATALATIG